jgi:peptidylprolyl isomerase
MRPTLRFLFAATLLLCACQAKRESSETQLGEGAQSQPVGVTLPGGLVYQDYVVGSGTVADGGMRATVHYTGWLEDGTKFSSSYDENQPTEFMIGAGEVIQGWEQGVKGMRVGGKRKLIIPPELGYGDAGRPPIIPPGATLIFSIELVRLG